MKTVVRNLCSPLPDATLSEISETLVSARGLRLERIVSHGQASPDGFWYDQNEAEWVVVICGNARVAIEGETNEHVLGQGDALFLPAHCRHRVAWTDPSQPTIWVALFLDQGLAPIAHELK